MPNYETEVNSQTGELNDFPPLPIGEYKCGIKSVEKLVKNQPYLKVVFEVREPAEFEGRQIFYNAPFNTSFLDALLVSMGYELPEAGQKYKFSTDDWDTKELVVKIKHELYQGKEKDKVESMRAIAQTAAKSSKKKSGSEPSVPF